MGDVIDVIKGIFYDIFKLKILSGDSIVIVMNYIFKNEGEFVVVIIKNMKVLKIGIMEVL